MIQTLISFVFTIALVCIIYMYGVFSLFFFYFYLFICFLVPCVILLLLYLSLYVNNDRRHEKTLVVHRFMPFGFVQHILLQSCGDTMIFFFCCVSNFQYSVVVDIMCAMCCMCNFISVDDIFFLSSFYSYICININVYIDSLVFLTTPRLCILCMWCCL